MRNSKSHLKACPFCGESIARLSEWNDIDGANYWVFCQGCNAGTALFPHKKAAITAWNRRASPKNYHVP